jgi:predicted helicase
MSRQLINQYYTKLERIIQYGGSRNETAIRQAFYALLNDYANKKNLELITEIRIKGTKGNEVQPDGVLKNALRLDFGYWESKDESDDIEEEIDKKLKKGYPLTNALFEDSATAVLYQNGELLLRADMKTPEELERILQAFVNFEKPEIRDFIEAIEKFKEDLPTIIETLRKKIKEEGEHNKKFVDARQKFWEHCQAEINPEITLADIGEMIIQHIATSDIFNNIFNDPDFHRQNNIAQQIEQLVSIIFTRSVRQNMLDSMRSYYGAIKEASSSIADHHEKQKFLKVLYENFYKAYNPKGADRLGVVYTPNEIVHFMIESTEYLLERHFGKTLADKNVEILDPATGTGTFICDLIEYLPKQHLAHKFKEEIHANEVAILPYYIANLNIEYTFKQKMGYYEEYKNICFVDTLDNIEGLKFERGYSDQGIQKQLFGISSENAERIKKQNRKKISVVIGNPPYNAKQENYNSQNANRFYKAIDKRIKDTFIKNGTAQNQIVVYDMYTRFYRWAMDRIDRNGIITMITNRSFIDGRALDGFRKSIQDEFSHCYIIDTKSDVRTNPKIAGTTHNVFGIQTGVAIMFLVRKEKRESTCRIEYMALDDFALKAEKLSWLKENKLKDIAFEKITPDTKNNWINLTDNDFEELIPVVSKETKSGKEDNAIFKTFSSGIKSQRDEWVYDVSKRELEKKVKFFIEEYSKTLSDKKYKGRESIKWDRELTKYLERKVKINFEKAKLIQCSYRPFSKQFFYFDEHLNGMTYQWFEIYNANNLDNRFIAFNSPGNPKGHFTIGSSDIIDLHFTGDSQCLPLYRYDDKGKRHDNITDWGLDQFQTHYKNKKITKEDIFYYTYAVLHNPAYRTKYELNLKREFPRLPYYENFKQWKDWGNKLMDLHINYEQAKPFALKLITSNSAEELKKVKELFNKAEEPEALYHHRGYPKVKLKADKEKGIIEIDEHTLLTGVPPSAWEYKLGNRSALEWILDQYKEKKYSDPTIAEKFNTYRFADYKEHVIELLKKVCTVSVETMKIIEQMIDSKH